ncbi:MAG TPA: CmcI family methyltransferase [Dongiaceae bacterium]|nr:CmcI family methyltransferase [Dongiaceae bacterium]
MNFRSLFGVPEKPFADPVINGGCTFFEVNNWTLSQFVVERLVPKVGFHPFPLNEQMLMTAAVCRIRPTHILEWGTNIGVSARIFYEICRAFSLDTEIHSIDLPDHERHEEHPGQQRGRLVRGIPQVRLYQGDGLDVALNVLAAASLPVKALFFLDGDHSYESVYRELDAIIGTDPAASILLHDTFFQSEESGYNTGPHRAMHDIIRKTGADFEIISQDIGLPGMTFLWRRA